LYMFINSLFTIIMMS